MRAYKELIKSHNKYISAIGSLQREIVDKVEFDFSISYQDSDGFVIVHYDENRNGILERCLDIIKKEGKLTYESYLTTCI